MYGNSVEKLHVYIRTYQNGSVGQPIVKLVGGQGSLWNRAVVPLNSNKNFHVCMAKILSLGSLLRLVL